MAKNTVLTDGDGGSVLHPLTGFDQVVNKATGESLDSWIYDVIEKINFAFLETNKLKVFNHINQIGIDSGKETMESIASHLDTNSILLYRKGGYLESDDLYPQRVGLLFVKKGRLKDSVSFLFHGHAGFFYGFCDLGKSQPWSGWRKVGAYTDIETLGLSIGSETIKDYHNRLQDGEEIIVRITSNYNTSIYPGNVGLLKVSKHESRSSFTFSREDSHHFGHYNDFSSPEWSGWNPLNELKDHVSLSSIGLGRVNITPRKIFEALGNNETLSVRIEDGVDSGDYPRSAGNLRVRRTDSRASFYFEHEDGLYYGQYNSVEAGWYGWKKIPMEDI